MNLNKLLRLAQNNILLFCLLILVTIPSFSSLIRPGFFFMQDDLQAFRIFEMNQCFLDGQIPCHWVPDAGYEYGYPQFMYYSPSVYYLGELIHLVGFQIIDSVKILFALGYILAAISMFIFLRIFLNDWAAFIGAILYTYAPYKAVEVYVRGAMSEFWSFVFFPLIFLSIYQIIKTKEKKYILLLGFSVGTQLITHNLMSLIFMPLAVIWALLWVVLEKNPKILIKIFLGALLGVGLSSFFTIPLIFQRGDVHLESLVGGYFDYRQHFVDINQLFISNHWGYGSSILGPGDDLSLSAGIVHWIISLCAVIISIIFFHKNKKLSIAVFVLAILEMIVLFLMHQKSSFIWSILTPLVWLQFPWRFLSDSTFLLSILGSACIYILQRNVSSKISLVIGVIIIATLFVLHGSFFQPKNWFNLADEQKFSGSLWEKELTISIFDYLPIYATLPPNHKAPNLPEVLSGKAQFLSYKKGSDYQYGSVNVDGGALLRIPLFDFPGMEVRVDGKVVPHSHNNCSNEPFCFGLINFSLSKGVHELRIRLTDTWPVRAGNLITLASLFIIGAALVIKRKNEHKFV